MRVRWLTLPAVGCIALLATLSPAGAATGSAARQGSQRAISVSPHCPWLDTSLSVRERINLLLPKMTLADKIDLMEGHNYYAPNGAIGYTDPIPALCVPIVTEEDGPAGVADGVNGATQLPAPVNDAATWDPNETRQYGAVIGNEEWVKGNDVVYGPTINIDRDPRWGRNFESLSEDPYLTGTLAAAEIQGIQSQGPIAEVKHYVVYNQETNRNTPADDDIVSARAIHEIYLPGFYDAVTKGKAGAVMCAYSSPNGVYACQNPLLSILENDWGWPGFVGSDYGATHSTVASANAGLDQEQASSYFSALPAAVAAGQVSMTTINEAVTRILTEMFRFGLFNHQPTGTESTDASTPAHIAFAQQNSEEGTVLLKNAGNVLPLTSSTSSIAVIGADGSTDPETAGGGSAAVNPSQPAVSPLQGITARAGSGVTVTSYAGTTPSAAAQTARKADVAIVFANNYESEGYDLPNITLQGNQNAVISAVARANPHTIVVLNTGGPVTMPWLSQVEGVLEAWYPGQQDGDAIASILFGDTDPSGHLPETFPASLKQIPDPKKSEFPGVNGEVHYNEGLEVGYRYYDTAGVTPLFPFGYGLSYTTFSYSGLKLSATNVKNTVSGPGGGQSATLVKVTATVTNTGSVAGSDVAQMYLGDPASAGEPALQLEGYQRVTLQPGQSTQVHFTLDGHALSYYDTSANGWVLPDGDYTVYAGDSSALANLPLQKGFTVTRSVGARTVTLSAPSTVAPDSAFTATATFANDGDYAVDNAQADLRAPAGWTVTPVSRMPSRVLAHQSVTLSWKVTVPTSAQGTSGTVTAAISGVTAGGQPTTVTSQSSQVTVSPMVNVTATPPTLSLLPGASGPVTLQFASQVPDQVTVRVKASPPSGISVTPASAAVPVPANGNATATLAVAVASGTTPGTYMVPLALTAAEGAKSYGLSPIDLTVNVAYSSLAAAFDNTGIANESDPASANFDGSGYSYSEQQLTAAGEAPGATVTHDGISYTWPSSAPGTPDDVVAGGQAVALSGSGSSLGILAAANNGSSTGTVTVTYTDGTTSTAQISINDWYDNAALPGSDILVTTPDWNQPPGGIGDHAVSVYATSIPLDPGKTVASVTLPDVSSGVAPGQNALHIFALAIG
jgi:beta-glucosidase